MEILEHFKKIISDSKYPFVLEFGCCDSFHSDLMLSAIKETWKPFIFHCFEPVPDLQESILNNLKKHLIYNTGLIAYYPFAVGSEDGEVTLYKSSGEKIQNGHVVDRYYGSSSIRKPTGVLQSFPSMKFEETKAQSITLDKHIENCGLKGYPIDFIWTDIQGAEVDLIKGGIDTFKNVRYFYTEYENGSYEGQIGLSGIQELLPHFSIVEDYGGDVLLRNRIMD